MKRLFDQNLSFKLCSPIFSPTLNRFGVKTVPSYAAQRAKITVFKPPEINGVGAAANNSIMKLQKDHEFYELLPKFDVITCDSQILVMAARLMGTPLKERVSGSDYFPRFYMRYKEDRSVRVFICGGAPGIAEIPRRNVNAKVGREMVVGTSAPSRDYDRSPAEIERSSDRAIERSSDRADHRPDQ
jgi:UDP-N-acetyl-D-mannosaminuronic acid transferase (WecB/TagA/CpsF family)